MRKALAILAIILALSMAPQAGASTPETPWRTNQHGAIMPAEAWSSNMTLGYNFRAEQDGQIIGLGANVPGSKMVYLWDWSNMGTARFLVRSASVMSDDAWAYTPIAPYPVVAGRTYTVAVYMAGERGTWRESTQFPSRYGSITILNSAGIEGCGFPTRGWGAWGMMYGQADIQFVGG
jgi:hypothetical protein